MELETERQEDVKIGPSCCFTKNEITTRMNSTLFARCRDQKKKTRSILDLGGNDGMLGTAGVDGGMLSTANDGGDGGMLSTANDGGDMLDSETR